MGVELCKAGGAMAHVDHRFVSQAARFGEHRFYIAAKHLQDALAHARLGCDDGKDMDH